MKFFIIVCCLLLCKIGADEPAKEDFDSKIKALKKTRDETRLQAETTAASADQLLQKDWDKYRRAIEKEAILKQKVTQLDKQITELEKEKNSKRQITVGSDSK